MPPRHSRGDSYRTLGNVAAVPAGKIALAQRVITLVPLEGLDRGFLLWLLLWDGSKRRIARYATGSTVLGVKQSVFRRIPFAFAPLPEQRAIAKALDASQERLQAETVSLAKFRTLKQGLMDDLLTGRVRVPSPEEAPA